jgi:hypothetical protein
VRGMDKIIIAKNVFRSIPREITVR